MNIKSRGLDKKAETERQIFEIGSQIDQIVFTNVIDYSTSARFR